MLTKTESQLFDWLQENIADHQGMQQKPARFASHSVRFLMNLGKDYFEGKLTYTS